MKEYLITHHCIRSIYPIVPTDWHNTSVLLLQYARNTEEKNMWRPFDVLVRIGCLAAWVYQSVWKVRLCAPLSRLCPQKTNMQLYSLHSCCNAYKYR